MDFARKILDNNNNNNIVHTATDLIDSFAKCYKINENDHTFSIG